MSVKTSLWDSFKAADAASYDRVAGRFDDFSERLTPPLAAQIVALAELQPRHNVLDVGTETGVVALTAAQQLDSDALVLDIDLSDGMSERGRAKASWLGRRVRFEKMDAENLALENECFDVVMNSG